MDTLETIFSRRSIRCFTDQKISDADLNTILKAGMSGPSCVNSRDWCFLVVRDRERLCSMAEKNGHPARHLKNASLGILICGDLSRSFEGAKDYWVIDASIATQNMTLAAHALGIGSVWLGTWPQMDRVTAQSELFSLPDHIVPHSILALGFPDEEKEKREIWEEDRIHHEKW